MHTVDKRTTRAWHAATVLFMLVCGYVLVAGRNHVYMDKTGPGPGFFPTWIGGLGLVIGFALLLVINRRGADAQEPWSWPARPETVRILVTVAAIALAGFALETLGFRLTMFAFIAVLLRAYGVRSLAVVLIASASAAAILYLVFNTVLKVLLPIGALGF